MGTWNYVGMWQAGLRTGSVLQGPLHSSLRSPCWRGHDSDRDNLFVRNFKKGHQPQWALCNLSIIFITYVGAGLPFTCWLCHWEKQSHIVGGWGNLSAGGLGQGSGRHSSAQKIKDLWLEINYAHFSRRHYSTAVDRWCTYILKPATGDLTSWVAGDAISRFELTGELTRLQLFPVTF